MNKITHLAAVAAATCAALTAAPATSHAETCAPEAVTLDEYNQFAFGMFKSKVFEIVGSRGERDREHTYEGPGEYLLRTWDYCNVDDSLSPQTVVFERSPAGRWVVVEIG